MGDIVRFELSPVRITSKVALPTIWKFENSHLRPDFTDSTSLPSSSTSRIPTSESIAHKQALTSSSNIAIEVHESAGDSDFVSYYSNRNHRRSPISNKENTSLESQKHASDPTPGTLGNKNITKPVNSNPHIANSELSTRSGLKLKLKLRGVQGALQEWNETTTMQPVGSHKRAFSETVAYDEDETDSEIEFIAPVPRSKKVVKSSTPLMRSQARTTTVGKTKRAKLAHYSSINHDGDDAVFDAGDEGESSDKASAQKLSLITPLIKRNKRILNPEKPDHARLIATATKAGVEYYDSDDSELAGPVKDTTKPHLFRNVKWGSHATDYSNDAQFLTEPEFTQFVPGRFELLPDNTVADQKAKLIVKLTDIHGKKRIFANPPPRDWNNQVAITTLNKRTVQQIRRNTHVRFRDVVIAYVAEEREWILNNLTNGKPTNGWKRFVDDFNANFEGKLIKDVKNARPFRSHSSLTKEVERFGAKWYSRGLVPVPVKQGAKKSEKKDQAI